MEYYVYVLKSVSTGRSYIGHSGNLINRVEEHNSGKSLATHGRGPWELVYHEIFKSRSDAMKREKYFKTQIGRLNLKKKCVLR